MRLSAMFNDDVAYDLGLTLEDTYILGYLYKVGTTTEDTKIIDGQECFTFNLVDLFKSRRRVFEQIPYDIEEKMNHDDKKVKEEIQRIYELNRRRFERIMKKNICKVVKRVKNIKTNEGSKTYYRIERVILKMLIDGYPTKVDTEFTDIEKLVMKELNLFTLTKSISTQLKNMDEETLQEALEVAKENGIHDFPYVRGIYNNLIESKKAASAANTNDSSRNKISLNNSNNSIPNNIPKSNTKKTKFHNCNETFKKYDPDELEQMLLESQKDKFRW